MKNFAATLRALALRYARALARVATGLALAAVAVLAAWAIVWPLWKLATAERAVYSLVVAGAFALAAIAFVAARVLRAARLSRRDSRLERKKGWLRALSVLVLLAGLWASWLLWSKLSPFAAVPLAVVVLFGTGFLRDAARRPR